MCPLNKCNIWLVYFTVAKSLFSISIHCDCSMPNPDWLMFLTYVLLNILIIASLLQYPFKTYTVSGTISPTFCSILRYIYPCFRGLARLASCTPSHSFDLSPNQAGCLISLLSRSFQSSFNKWHKSRNWLQWFKTFS